MRGMFSSSSSRAHLICEACECAGGGDESTGDESPCHDPTRMGGGTAGDQRADGTRESGPTLQS